MLPLSVPHMLHGKKVIEAVVHNGFADSLYHVNFLKKTCIKRYLLLTFTVYLPQ